MLWLLLIVGAWFGSLIPLGALYVAVVVWQRIRPISPARSVTVPVGTIRTRAPSQVVP